MNWRLLINDEQCCNNAIVIRRFPDPDGRRWVSVDVTWKPSPGGMVHYEAQFRTSTVQVRGMQA